MGYRLISDPPLTVRNAANLVSQPVVPGTIQIPPDGQPIVLQADSQTVGGYPVAAYVISADLPLLAQLQTGQKIIFRQVSDEEARAANLREWYDINELKEGIRCRL
jgi:antagonist of KipI